MKQFYFKNIFLSKTYNLFLFLFFILYVTNSMGQTTLVQYNFDNSSNPLAPNINNTASASTFSQNRVGNNMYYNYNGCGGSTSSTYVRNAWNADDYYRIAVNTTGFANLSFSYCNGAQNSNIKNFDIRYSIDNGTTITPVSGSAYVPKTSVEIKTVALPSVINNQGNVFIYIYKTDKSGADGTYLLVDNITLEGSKIPSISSFSPSSGCANSTPVKITGTNFMGATAVTFGGTPAASFIINSPTQITATPAAGTTGTIKVTTPGGTATSTSSFTVSPLSTVGVSIAANPSLPVCSGTPVTNTATPTNGGPSPAYQWKLNGTNVGTNSPTYSYTPVNGDQLSVVLTSNDACASGSLTQPILNFSWNDPTKAITDSDYGMDALSGSGQYVTGADGKLSLAPITSPKTDINLTFDGTAPEFNSEGIDYSVKYVRNETTSELFSRGNSLIITGGSNFSVSYRVSDGAGSFTTVTSGNFPIPSDNTFHNYRFRYDPSDGYGRLYVDGAQVWISPTSTLGKPMYWTNAGNIVVGRLTDASGNRSPTLNSLLMNAVYIRSAASQMTMMVSPVISNNGISSSQNICASTSPSPLIGSTPSGGSGSYVYLWESSITSETSGFSTASGTSNLIGYTAGALTKTTWYRRTVTSGGCFNTSTPIKITVNALPTVVVNGPLEITCINATAALSGAGSQGSAVTYSWSTTNGAFSGATNTINATATTAGTYTLTVTNTATGCSAAKIVSVTKNIPINKWSGGSWSIIGGPSLEQDLVFEENFNSITDDADGVVEGCSCLVNVGKAVEFKLGHSLIIRNNVKVNGILTFENNASLVQINDTPAIPNSGTITYKRQTTIIDKFDYTYWSSPVKNQLLLKVSPNTLGDKFYSFNANGNNWNNEDAYNNKMVPAKGYIIRGPQNFYAPNPPTGIHEASFIGEPNNGGISIPVGNAGTYNLIGNPYPSAIDAELFIKQNSSVLNGTLYFWTHKTHIGIGVSNPGSGVYAYSSDDYAPLNLTGAVSTTVGTILNAINNSNPTATISAGQSFFASSKAAGNAVFNNSMRVGGGLLGINNSQFFKTKSNAKLETKIEKNRVWLNLTNSEGAFKQTLIGYITGATNEYDSAYDGKSFNANAFVNFYSLQENLKLAIQGKALPFDENDIVPLGYKTTIAGEFKIAIEQTDGLLSNKKIFLEDKLMGKIQDLSEGAYLFTTEIGTFDDRFILSYTNKTLGTDDYEVVENGVVITSKHKEIKITSSENAIAKIFVYDLSGRQIYLNSKIDKREFIINNLNSSDQVLIIKVILDNKKVMTQKIIF
ncbi:MULTISPECIES: T9SS sorting signal type C domain-containing protein [unclassified Flavobacterium]|uniref:T9SS sorting signal type C domain-containing protein n=1 Tax=unclassified Flavobacterium TaxID=196869 RepID=UPI003F930DD3